MLQTPDYAKATLASAGLNNAEDLVQARLARQEILNRQNRPLLWILMDQVALLRPVGGRDVMHAQLTRLLEVSELPNVILRVVPLEAGAHMGLDGAFKLMRVETADIAYAEAPVGGRLILDSDEVTAIGIRYDRIGAKALPEDLSRGLILNAMESMR